MTNDYDRRRFWLGAGAALLAGLLLRLWFIGHLSRVAGDSLVYGDIAKNLLLHRIYGITESGATPRAINPTLIRLPGYPLFLAACFRIFGMEHYRAVLYLQLAADLITCWLCAALAGRLFGRRAMLPVLWLAALCPFTAAYVATPLTETLVLTSIALTFYAFGRWQEAGAGYNRWLWLLAAALAWSILLRPEQGLLAAAVIPAMLWRALAAPQGPDRRSRVRIPVAAPVLAAALCTVLPLLPWTIRNWRTFHVFQPLAPRSALDPGEREFNGFPRWYRTWAIDFDSTANVYWNYWSDRIEARDLPARAYALGCTAHADTSSSDLQHRTVVLLDAYNQRALAMPAIDARFNELGRERIQASPLCYYVGLPVARLLNMVLRPRTELTELPLEWWRWSEHPAKTMLAVALASLNFAYLAVAGAGFFVWRRRGWLGAPEIACAMAASILLRCALLLTLDNSEPRYTLEFYPVLLVWAGALFDQSGAASSAARPVL
jgi:4-amino-4-deoxy-L-arabinose transferase-like glycosyltransferase